MIYFIVEFEYSVLIVLNRDELYRYRYCKLRNGIKKEEYLELTKTRQVAEHVWFDWCDFIGMQITIR
jgi:hypothetical protein